MTRTALIATIASLTLTAAAANATTSLQGKSAAGIVATTGTATTGDGLVDGHDFTTWQR